jgi:hypothetical protein
MVEWDKKFAEIFVCIGDTHIGTASIARLTSIKSVNDERQKFNHRFLKISKNVSF